MLVQKVDAELLRVPDLERGLAFHGLSKGTDAAPSGA
jgi:hypothetical protein